MTASQGSTRSQRWRWPLLLALVLVGQAGGVIAMVVVSGRDASFAIEPDYYEKALAWDEASRLRAASESLDIAQYSAIYRLTQQFLGFDTCRDYIVDQPSASVYRRQ